ncbi:MAG TPA: alkaline phosphatase family protein [Acidimicrobiales bacterium]
MLERAEVRKAKRRVGKQQANLASARPDLTKEQGADSIPEVEHIVILMMENHSYDNYFGMLAGHGDGFNLGTDGQPTESNNKADGSAVPLTHFSGTRQVAGLPTQTWNASHIQDNDGACDGFVRSIEETLPGKDASRAMTYWTEQDLPFYYGLAKTFPLATRWFSSCLGPTFPNRRFMIAGTAHGLIDDLPFGMGDYPEAGTIFDLLTAHNISWINYHNVAPWQLNFKRLFHTPGVNIVRMIGAFFAWIFPSLLKAVQSKLQCTADLYPLGTLRSINHLRTMSQLFVDARNGTMPSVSIIDPDFGQWSEENPQDIQDGEAFASKVINAVMSGEGWPRTLLIWVYDEHGGYYDHVAPPPAPIPDDIPGANPLKRHWWLGLLLRFTPYSKKVNVSDSGQTAYDRLGFRVPAVIVSPYARPNFVSDTIYDHTSILKLIEKKWNLPALTHRDAAATDPLDALDFENPPRFLHPPTLPAPAGRINL